MARFPELDVAQLTPEQKKVYDTIASGPRGGVRGPLAVWLRRPELAQWAQGLGEYCRYNSSIEKRLSELAILATARLWGSEYEWFAHEPQARAAGVPEATIEAIRVNGTPKFHNEDEAVVYEVATTLNRTRQIPDALYQKAVSLIGEGKMVDLIGILGYYTLISMTINAFHVEPPPGSPKRLWERRLSMSEATKTYLDNPNTPKLKLPEGSWDAHFHIFGPGDKFPYASTYSQHVADAPKDKLVALHKKLGIARGVFVQSGAHGFDNRAVEDALQDNPAYLGVALARTDVPDEELRRLDALGFRAVRFNYMPHLGPGAPLDDVLALAKRLAPLGWHLQLHPAAAVLGEMMPKLKQSPVPVSIDHMARIDAKAGMNQPGFVNLLKLMEDDRFWVKFSGCDRITAEGPPYKDAIPYAQKLVSAFPDRCVWGTDWPHPNHQPPIPDDGVLVDILADIAPDEASRRKLLVDNPIRLYRPKA